MNIEQAIEKYKELKPLADEFRQMETIVNAYDLVIAKLKDSRIKGMTKRDLSRHIKIFGTLSHEQSDELLKNMVDKSLIELREVKRMAANGRKRVAYFYIESNGQPVNQKGKTL